MKKHRVVVTGVGVVAPNGVRKEAFWQALMTGLTGVRSIRRFDSTPFQTQIAGEIVDFNPLDFFDARELKKVDRSNTYAMAAGLMALEDSGLDLATENRERIGSAIGNSLGGVEYVDKEIDVMRDKGPRWGSPYLAIAFFSCGTNGLFSIRLGLKGPVLTLCNGNTSGGDGVGMAYRSIQSGRADVMFAGGTEAPLIPLFLGSFSRDNLLSNRNDSPSEALRPFHSQADGMVLSEGAGIVVMESLEHAQARGAHIYAEVVGYASGSSAFDVLKPEPSGSGLVTTMNRAMQEARIQPQDVSVVHAQGFSLPEFDEMEARCVSQVFQSATQAPAVTAVSSWAGNGLGALGGWQTAASVLMVESGRIPSIANVERAKVPHGLSVVEQAVDSQTVDVVVQNAFCFLGKSNTLILRRYVA